MSGPAPDDGREVVAEKDPAVGGVVVLAVAEPVGE